MIDHKFLLGAGFGILAVIGFFAVVTSTGQTVEGGFPPTNSYSQIWSNDTDSTTNPIGYNATQYNNDLVIITDGSILVEMIKYSGGAE